MRCLVLMSLLLILLGCGRQTQDDFDWDYVQEKVSEQWPFPSGKWKATGCRRFYVGQPGDPHFARSGVAVGCASVIKDGRLEMEFKLYVAEGRKVEDPTPPFRFEIDVDGLTSEPVSVETAGSGVEVMVSASTNANGKKVYCVEFSRGDERAEVRLNADGGIPFGSHE